MQPLSALLPASTQGTMIRLLRASDLQQFHDYRSDAGLARYQGWTPMDLVATGNFIREMALASALLPGSWIQLGIAMGSTNELVGDVGVCVGAEPQSAEVGFTIARAAQGAGLGTEAVGGLIEFIFEQTDVTKVVAVADQRNIPAGRLLERVGMRKIETLHTIFRGEPCVEHVWTISRAAAGNQSARSNQ